MSVLLCSQTNSFQLRLLACRNDRACFYLCKLTVVIDGVGDDGRKRGVVHSGLILQENLEAKTHHIQIIFLSLQQLFPGNCGHKTYVKCCSVHKKHINTLILDVICVSKQSRRYWESHVNEVNEEESGRARRKWNRHENENQVSLFKTSWHILTWEFFHDKKACSSEKYKLSTVMQKINNILF